MDIKLKSRFPRNHKLQYIYDNTWKLVPDNEFPWLSVTHNKFKEIYYVDLVDGPNLIINDKIEDYIIKCMYQKNGSIYLILIKE
jgi:hypothetical protein